MQNASPSQSASAVVLLLPQRSRTGHVGPLPFRVCCVGCLCNVHRNVQVRACNAVLATQPPRGPARREAEAAWRSGLRSDPRAARKKGGCFGSGTEGPEARHRRPSPAPLSQGRAHKLRALVPACASPRGTTWHGVPKAGENTYKSHAGIAVERPPQRPLLVVSHVCRLPSPEKAQFPARVLDVRRPTTTTGPETSGVVAAAAVRSTVVLILVLFVLYSSA